MPDCTVYILGAVTSPNFWPRQISAQSSIVITLQSLDVHFSSAAIDRLSSAADRLHSLVFLHCECPGQAGASHSAGPERFRSRIRF
jgi:hypothetical protein